MTDQPWLVFSESHPLAFFLSFDHPAGCLSITTGLHRIFPEDTSRVRQKQKSHNNVGTPQLPPSVECKPKVVKSPVNISTMNKCPKSARKFSHRSSLIAGGNESETVALKLAGKMSKASELPIWLYRNAIMDAVERNRVTIIVGETGSGKTTQVPQFLHSCGFTKGGVICVTQPRRIAAVSMARRVAQEMGEDNVGGFVGYSIRFHDETSKATRVKFVTDGMLIRDSMIDSMLRQYSVLVIDEAHERSLRTDILFGLVKQLLEKRQDVKMVVMSATLEHRKFRKFFEGAEMLFIPGRQHPVDIYYTPSSEEDYLEAALITTLQIHLEEAAGDILVFLPGQEDIEALHSRLDGMRSILSQSAQLCKQRAEGELALSLLKLDTDKKSGRLQETTETTTLTSGKSSYVSNVVVCTLRIGSRAYKITKPPLELLVCPIYASLPFDQQVEVFKKTPSNMRKIVLATNIAETSITISGIRFVVDAGLVKLKTYNPKTGVEILSLQEVSKASANQRAGRAGREAPGKAYRLFTEKAFDHLQTHNQPEIMRCDLAQVYLDLKAIGVINPLNFPFMDTPSKDTMIKAGTTLLRIGALDRMGSLTTFGRKLSAFPLDPLISKLLLDSIELECTSEIMSIVAMLSTDVIWVQTKNSGSERGKCEIARKKLFHPDGDHLTLLNLYQMWEEAEDRVGFCKVLNLNRYAMDKSKNIREQLKDILLSDSIGVKSISKCRGSDEWIKVRQCLAKGCWLHAARLDPAGKSYVTEIGRQTVNLHPTSVLFGTHPLPSWIVFNEYVQTRKPYIRNVTAIDPNWLMEFVPKCFAAHLGTFDKS